MANLEQNSRKRTLNPKLSSTDNVSQEAANLKWQKIDKGTVTATTSKKNQTSVQDSDEEDNNVQKQSHFGQPNNPRAEKGAVTATTSKKHRASVQDSDEDDNVPKQSRFRRPNEASDVDVEMLDEEQPVTI